MRGSTAYTIGARDYKGALCVMVKILENHPADSRVKICEDGIFQTLSSRMGTGGGNVPMVLMDQGGSQMSVEENQTGTLRAEAHGNQPILIESNQNHATIQTDRISTALPAAMGEGGGYIPMITEQAVVRRLTPLECTRLQGYPDGWVDIGDWTDSKGKIHKDADSPKYKALGNSIALPFWEWMAKRMVKHLDTENPTMASLFDGIGGFPLVFQRAGVKAIWASEIEEFPIAVTKKHFPEVEE